MKALRVATSAAVLLATVGVVAATATVTIEDWKNIPRNATSWQSATLQAKEMMYPEGGTIPYRLTLPHPGAGSTWTITLEYDFADEATGAHFCDFLTSYDSFEGSVRAHAYDGSASNGGVTFGIPYDASLSFQTPGVFTVANGTITNVSTYTTYSTGGVTVKQLTLTGVAASDGDVLVLFGAHLARDYEWGTDKGAHGWASGTASIGFTNYNSAFGKDIGGKTNLKISDNILDNLSQSDLSVVATPATDPVYAGQILTYDIIVNNTGPLASNSDTLTDAIPAGTTFVSATTPAGWTLTAPAVGGTGTVKWFGPTAFNAGGGAAFQLVVTVNGAAGGTLENTANVAAGNLDAYQANNSFHTSTAIGSLPPVVMGGGSPDDPQNGDPGTDPGDSERLRPSDRPSGHNPNGGLGSGSQPGAGEPGDDTREVLPQGAGSGNATGPAPEAPAADGTFERASPNPFRSETHLAYAVTGAAESVEIRVYDIAGREVTVLASGIQSAGRHDVAWDGRDQSGARVETGVYFVRVQVGSQSRQVRVTSVR